MMKSKRTDELELNQLQVPRAIFLKAYNQNIPEGFPQASVDVLQKFRNAHPSLFRSGEMWSVDRHRKRLMDWLSSYRGAV